MKVHVTLALTQRLDEDFGTQAHIRMNYQRFDKTDQMQLQRSNIF